MSLFPPELWTNRLYLEWLCRETADVLEYY